MPKVAKQQVYVKIVDDEGNTVAISGPYWATSLEPNENDEIILNLVNTAVE